MTHPGNRRPGGTPPPSVPLSPGRVVRTGAGGSSTPPTGGTTGGWLSGCFLIVAIPITVLALLSGARGCQQDGPGKPDNYKPSNQPGNVWVDPSGSPKPLPSGMKTGQQPAPAVTR